MIRIQEIRIDDYLKAYQSTGRPPQPCPQQPEDESQRTSLSLPPLFKPRPIRNFSTSATTSSSLLPFGTVNRTGNSTTDVQQLQSAAARIINPLELPPGQEFRLLSANGEKYHCISCMPEYTNFSQEVRVSFFYTLQDTLDVFSLFFFNQGTEVLCLLYGKYQTSNFCFDGSIRPTRERYTSCYHHSYRRSVPEYLCSAAV